MHISQPLYQLQLLQYSNIWKAKAIVTYLLFTCNYLWQPYNYGQTQSAYIWNTTIEDATRIESLCSAIQTKMKIFLFLCMAMQFPALVTTLVLQSSLQGVGTVMV